MQVSSLLGHTQELFLTIAKSTRSADAVIDSYFRSHKYLGSHDRRFIAETVYGALRYLRKCRWVLNSAFDGTDWTSYKQDEALLLIIRSTRYYSAPYLGKAQECRITRKAGRTSFGTLIAAGFAKSCRGAIRT
jgi:hypothetical protein